MDRKQKARCSGRGRGLPVGQQRSSLSPKSSGVRMQLRDPSVRRPSRHRTDAFEWPQLSPKGNRRNSLTKRLVVHLERIPASVYKDEPPMLQHYMQEADGSDLVTEDVPALPPNLLPEVIVTRGKKQRRLQREFEPSTSKSIVPPPAKRRRTLSSTTSSSLENLCENGSKRKSSSVVSGSKPRQNCMKSPSTNKTVLSEESDDTSDFDYENDFRPLSKNSITQDIIPKMRANFDSSVSRPPLHLPPPPLAGSSEKGDEKNSPTLSKEADDDCISGSVAESTGAWSDGLDELFQEPERISTGKEKVDTIDGVDFLSFETKADLLEFTAIEMDYINAPPSLASDDQSPTIVPTKTHDITKIKGWRTKHFAGNTNYNSDFEGFVPDYENMGKGRRSSITSGSLSPGLFSESHSVVDQGSDEEEDHPSKQSKENFPGPSEVGKFQQQGKIIKPVKLMSPQPLKVTNNDQSFGASSSLDQTWVEFAVSALVYRSPAETAKLRRSQAAQQDGDTDEMSEELPEEPEPKIVKKGARSRSRGGKIGRPIMYPLSPYMRKKMKMYREVYKKSPKPTKILPESKRRVAQRIKQTVNSLVSAVEMKLHHGKIISTSETGKEKTNRELRKLGHVLIDMEEKPRSLESRTKTENCQEEFCKLGCVCQSLETIPQPQGHCGKVDCMFECSCTEPVPTMVVERLIEDDKRDLAPAEKEFRNTVIRADDGIMVVQQRGRREIKMPGRFRDNMLTGDALLAVEHKFLRGRGPAKSKKETESEPQPIIQDQKPRVRKSLLNSKNQDSEAKKCFENDDIPQNINQYFNLPSPEMLYNPNSPEAVVSESTPLYNREGGFISRAMEEQFLASQVRVKEERQYDYEEDGGIEIDDMGWQSLDADVDLPKTAEEDDNEQQEFGKIISITSLAPEEFENAADESSSAQDINLTDQSITSNPPSVSNEQLDINTDSCNAVDTDIIIPTASKSNKKQKSKNSKKDFKSHAQSGEKKSKSVGDQSDPSHQRLAAKLRAKRLAEFFTTNSVVSTLVKSAYEFKPSVLQRDAITLLQWSTLKLRFNERSLQLWIKDSHRDFHFLVTESEEQPLPGYSNLWNHEIKESSSVPEVARQLQQTFTSIVDYQRCCILWCNGLNWEFIGTLLKNPNGKNAPATLHPSCKPKTWAKTVNLPTDSIQSKWYVLLLNNDFEALELKNENLQISYSKLNQVIGAAWRYKKTVYIEITKNSAHAHEAPFGLYAKPTEYRQVYIGPYRAKEHALLELVPYQGVICKSKIVSCLFEADLYADQPDKKHLMAPKKENSNEASNFIERDLSEPKQKSTEDIPSSSSSSMKEQMQKKRNVDQTDVPSIRLPLVTSSGRTRKIPKHLLEDMVVETIPEKRKKSLQEPTFESPPPVSVNTKGRPRKISQAEKTTPEKLEVVKRGRPKKYPESKEIEVTPLLFDEDDNDDEDIELQVDDSSSRPSSPIEELQQVEESSSSRPASTKDESESEDESEKSDCETEEQQPTSQDDNERSESDRANEGDEEISGQSSQKEKKKVVVKTGTLAKLVCSAAGVDPLPVVVYVNGSVRFFNPFGSKSVHFENLELAKRFLNFIFRTTAPGAALTWTLNMWTDLSPEASKHFKKLQQARVRISTVKDLDHAIGRDGSSRPVRHKWKPHQRKIVRKSSVQKIIDECEANGVFNEGDAPDQKSLFVSAYLKKITIKKQDTKTLSIPVPQDLLECSSASTINEEEDWLEEEMEIGGPSRIGEKLQLHRVMEKVRRRELAQRFRVLASMLVPPDMLERCSKIMVLQKAMQEIATIVKNEKKWKLERGRLEARREELFKSFSRTIAGMDRSKKTAAIVELRMLLDSGKCCSRSTSSSTSYKMKKSNVNLLKPTEMTPSTSMPRLSPIKKNPPKLIKPPKSPQKIKKLKKTGTSSLLKSAQPENRPPLPTVEAPNFEPAVSPASTSEMTSTFPEPPDAGRERQHSLSQQMLPLHKISHQSEPPPLVSSTPPTCRKSDLPCHVRITNDGKIYVPMNTAPQSASASVLLSRRMVITQPKLGKRSFSYTNFPSLGNCPDVVDLSDDDNELPSTVKKRPHGQYVGIRKEEEEEDIIINYQPQYSNTITTDRQEIEPNTSSKNEVSITKVRKKMEKKQKTYATKKFASKFNTLFNSSYLSETSTTSHNNVEIVPDIVILPASSYGSKSELKNASSLQIKKDVPKLQVPDPQSKIISPARSLSAPQSNPQPSFSRPSKPSMTISEASNTLISKPSASQPLTYGASKPSMTISEASNTLISKPSASQPLTYGASKTSMTSEASNTLISKPSASQPLIYGASKPSMTISKASNTLISQPTISRPLTSEASQLSMTSEASNPCISQPSVTRPLPSQLSVTRPLKSQPKASGPLTSHPKASRPLIYDKVQNKVAAKHQVVVKPNGNHITLMPAGASKVRKIAPQTQQSIQKRMALEFQAPKFVINKEVMRARLNAVKPMQRKILPATAVPSVNSPLLSTVNVLPLNFLKETTAPTTSTISEMKDTAQMTASSTPAISKASITTTSKEMTAPTTAAISEIIKNASPLTKVVQPIFTVPLKNVPPLFAMTSPVLPSATSIIPETDQVSGDKA